MHAAHDDVDSRQQIFGLVERAVFEDVDFDPGQQPERSEPFVDFGDDVELFFEAFGSETVRDRKARRVIGEREILVAECTRLVGHRIDRVATVRPVGVRVQVALQLRAQCFTRVGAGLGDVAEQCGEIRRGFTGQRFGDHGGRLLADAGDVGEAAVVGEELQLRLRHVLDLARGAPECLGAVRGLAPAGQELGNPLERLDRCHVSTVPSRSWVSTKSTFFPRVINVMLGNKEFGKVRQEACAGLAGDVVEIGFGSGLNMPFLPREVTGIWAVDPSGTAMKLAAKRIAASTIPVHSAGLDGERLDLPDDRASTPRCRR